MSTLRRYVAWIAAVAAIILVWLQLPEDWPIAQPTGTLNTWLTWTFFVLAIAVVVILFSDRRQPEATSVEVEGPAFARYFFSNTRAGLFWLPIRLFLGLSWLRLGSTKRLAEAGSMVARRSRSTGSGQWRSPSREGPRSPTTGTATSSTSCSAVTTRHGSAGSSPSGRWLLVLA